jgi:Tfp pilus assembly protein PilF
MMLKKSHLAWFLASSTCLPFVSAARAVGQTEAERYAELGQKAMADGQYTVARSNFEQLAKLDPNLAEVHATLAVIDFKLREYESTISEFARLNGSSPACPGSTAC